MDRLGTSFVEWEALLQQENFRPAHALAIWRYLHRTTGEIPEKIRHWWDGLGEQPVSIRVVVPSTDKRTHKFLVRLQDGHDVETVIMHYKGRHTVCVSSQVGCAMGCGFCATGQMGFRRHLSAGEIVGQVALARAFLQQRGEEPPRNLVFMGMGEPLDNYDAVMKALEILCDDRGHNFGAGHITVSTVGVVPSIRRMALEGIPYGLAVSLHSTDNEERSSIVRANRRWPLLELLAACRYYNEVTGRRILFAWTLMEGHNDHPDQARKLVNLLDGLAAHVNLIRLNPTRAFKGRDTDDARAREFQAVIRAAGVPCTIRQHRGIDVAAGCGQLWTQQSTRSRMQSR